MHKMIWFQGKSILYPDLSYIQLSYKQFVLYWIGKGIFSIPSLRLVFMTKDRDRRRGIYV